MMNALTLPEEEFSDLRDRAAYVYATGALPTHLRTYMTSLLNKITRYSRAPASLDRRAGNLSIPRTQASVLALDDHPMISKVKTYIQEGYKIQVSRDPRTRRPFGKVFMYRRNRNGILDRLTVQSDGSVLSTW